MSLLAKLYNHRVIHAIHPDMKFSGLIAIALWLRVSISSAAGNPPLAFPGTPVPLEKYV